jgi:outer membrane protein assembly factor BamD
VSAVLLAGLLAGACSMISFDDSSPASPPEDKDSKPRKIGAPADPNETVGKIYRDAQAKLKNRDFEAAAKRFSEVERQYPYSTWARRAILMSAFAEYERNNYTGAVTAARRFISLYPGNKDAAYAYYLVGLSYYEQITDVGRDQEVTRKALAALTEVNRRFPGTQYAADAKQKAVLARDHLAGKEMKIGRYYLKRHSYIAAINRFRKVIKEYQTTTHTPEALMRLTEAYMVLGIKHEAQTAAAILGHNYPNSQWYQDAYVLLKSDGLAPRENRQSWISRAWNSMTVF